MGICVFQYIYVEFCNQEYKAIVEDQTRELEWSYHTQIQILSSSKIDDSILVSSLKFYVKTKKMIIYKTNIYVKWIFFFKKNLHGTRIPRISSILIPPKRLMIFAWPTISSNQSSIVALPSHQDSGIKCKKIREITSHKKNVSQLL